jgi:hypothetical protein
MFVIEILDALQLSTNNFPVLEVNSPVFSVCEGMHELLAHLYYVLHADINAYQRQVIQE